MRISDWSSDVCSSDLLNRVGPVDIAERVVAGRAAFPVRRVEQHNLLAALAAETRRDFVVLTLNIEHDNRIRPLQQIGNDDADALARSGRGRSEEHTSELQSLMRISYAVFCLKKKNNTYD